MSVGTYSLTTLEEVKSYYGLTVSGTDSILEGLIDSVSTLFETICNRKFKSRVHIEYHTTDGYKEIFPKQYPITTISGIYDDIACEYGSGTLVDSSSYTTIDDNTIILIGGLVFSSNEHETPNIKLVYTAGYETIPYDLEQVCIEEVLRKFKHTKDFDVTAKTLADGSTQYTSLDLLPQTKEVLTKYSRKDIA